MDPALPGDDSLTLSPVPGSLTASTPVPEHLGDYDLGPRLGAGGMGEVFEAVHRLIGKRVAIKVLHAQLAAHPELTAQMVAEARAVNAIRHRGVVDIFGFGELPDGRPYLVMELLEGHALDRSVAEGRGLPLGQALDVLLPVLDTLAAVHGAGLVHRDIKPSNIFLAREPGGSSIVKLLDFGLAAPQGAAGKLAGSEVVLGTLPYMAPEQLRGEPASPRSDLFTLGVVAHQLLTARLPFAGGGAVELLAQQRAGAPEARAFNDSVTPEVDAALRRLMAFRPGDRPATAQDAHRDLKALRPRRTAVVAPRLQPESRSWWARLRGLWSPAPPPAPVRAPSRPPPARSTGETAPDLLDVQELEVLPQAPPSPVDPEQLARLSGVAVAHLRQLSHVPSFPWLAVRAASLLHRPDVDVAELVQLVSQDPTLMAQVLRVANSAYASRGVEVKSIRDAVTRLGTREVASVAASCAAQALFSPDLATPGYLEVARRTWVYALTSAFGGGWLAMESRLDSQLGFMAGMLHDIGRVLSLQAVADLAREGKLGGLDPVPVLDALLDALHVDVGAAVVEEWKLQSTLVTICRDHHRADAEGPPDLHVVRVVSGLVEMHLNPRWRADRAAEVFQGARALGMDKTRLRAVSTQVRDFLRKAEGLLKAQAAGRA